MAENTKIEWADATINFWWGCEKVSTGCAHCYAETISKRVGDDIWGKDTPRRWIKSAVDDAIKLDKKAAKAGVKLRVFTNSMSDFFEEDDGKPIVDHEGNWLINCPNCGIEIYQHNEPPLPEGCVDRPLTLSDLRRQAFEVIDRTPNLIWMILTKRPERIQHEWWGNTITGFRPCHRQNVWLGTTVENQEMADERIPALLECRDLADKLFLSCEPLLAPVDLGVLLCGHCPKCGRDEGVWDSCICGFKRKQLPPLRHIEDESTYVADIGWVICGGESGHHARPMHPEWTRSLRDQCNAAGVPFFFKQWGEWVCADQVKDGIPVSKLEPMAAIDRAGVVIHDENAPIPRGMSIIHRYGKKNAGRLLDGREWNELPSY